jgi:hypothetical protein
MRRAALVVAVLVAVAAIGALVAWAGGERSSSHEPAAVAHAAAADHSAGAPVLSSNADVAAARAAAVRAVAMTGDVVRAGFISRRELIGSFTTPGYGPTLADETSEAVDAMLLELGERNADTANLAVVEQPVTATADATATGVRVRVWSVLVIAAPRVGPGRQVWRTVTLDMVKAAGRWLVDGWASTPGPSPAPPAEGSFDDAAAFVEPLGWPSATEPAATGGAG